MIQQTYFCPYVPQAPKTLTQKDTCTPIFIAALSVIAKM